MGLCDKVTLIFVIILIIQVACRHCMPRILQKSPLNRFHNNLKHVKSNRISTPFSQTQVNKSPKTRFQNGQNARINRHQTKGSMYKTYNFPETEYPLDTSPRDPFHHGVNYNANYQINMPQKRNYNSDCSIMNNLKREIKMKRKLSSNRQLYKKGSQSEHEMSSALAKYASGPDSVRLFDSGTFPEIQYPLNAMETWMPNYWNRLTFTQEEPRFDGFELPTFSPKITENIQKPVTKLTKAKANQFLKSYEKLKEEKKGTSTNNSKRSDVRNKGSNFTKTETCEKYTEDLITADIGTIITNSSNTNNTQKSISEKCSSVYQSAEIPYTVTEHDGENILYELKNNTKGHVLNNSEMTQTVDSETLQPFNDDTKSRSNIGPSGNIGNNDCRPSQQKTMNADCALTENSSNEYIPLTSINNFKQNDVGIKESNFTKIDNCEKYTEDLIITDLGKIVTNSSHTNNTLKSNAKITSISEKRCPVNQSVPIPYRGTEQDGENVCHTNELKNNTRQHNNGHDLNSSEMMQTIDSVTLQPVNDDPNVSISRSNIEPSGNLDNHDSRPSQQNTMHADSVITENSTEEYVPSSLKHYTTTSINSSIENFTTFISNEEKLENISTTTGSLKVRIPLPFTDSKPDTAPSNIPNYLSTNVATLTDVDDARGTSIIIIPINNAVSKSQSQTIETVAGTPIILYIPVTQNRDVPTQFIPRCRNQHVSSLLDKAMPNNQPCSVFSDTVPWLSETVTGISPNDVPNTGSALPVYETLPPNSMCYNYVNSRSLATGVPFFNKPLPHNISGNIPTCAGPLFIKEPKKSPTTSVLDFPPFHFLDSDLTLVSEKPDNIHIDKLPVTAREVNLDPLVSNISSKDLPGDRSPVNNTIPSGQFSIATCYSSQRTNNKTLPINPLSNIPSNIQPQEAVIHLLIPDSLSDNPSNSLPCPCPTNMFSETPIDCDTDILQVPMNARPLLEQHSTIPETFLSNITAESPTSNVSETAINFPLYMAPTLADATKKLITYYLSDGMQVPIDGLSMHVDKVVEGPFNIPINELPINKAHLETSLADILPDGLPLVKNDLLLPLGAAVSDSSRSSTPINNLQISSQNFQVDQNVPVILQTEMLPPDADYLSLDLTLPKTTLSEVSAYDPPIQMRLTVDDLSGPISDFEVNKNNPSTPLTDIIDWPRVTNILPIQVVSADLITPLSDVATNNSDFQTNKLTVDKQPLRKFTSVYSIDSKQLPIDGLSLLLEKVFPGSSNVSINDLSRAVNELTINKVHLNTPLAEIPPEGLSLVKDDLPLRVLAEVSDFSRHSTSVNDVQLLFQNFQADQNVPVIPHIEVNNFPAETDDLLLPLALTFPKTTLSNFSTIVPLTQMDNLSLPIDELARPISDFPIYNNNSVTPLTDIINRTAEANNLTVHMVLTILKTPMSDISPHNAALQMDNLPLLIDKELPNTSVNFEVPVDEVIPIFFNSDVLIDGLPIPNDEFLLPVNKNPPSVSTDNSPPTIIEMLSPMNKSSSITPLEDISPGYLPFATDNLSLPITTGVSNDFLVDNNLLGTLPPEASDLPTAIDDLSLLVEPAAHTTSGPKVTFDDPPLDMDNLTLPIDELISKTFISEIPINNSDSTVNIVSLPVGKCPPNMLSETLTNSDTDTFHVPIDDRSLLEQDRGSPETLLFNVPAKSPTSNVPEIASNFPLPMAPRLPHTPPSKVSTHELPLQMNKLSMDEPPAKKTISCYPTDSMQVPIDKLSMQVGNVVKGPSNIDVNDLSTAINQLPINKVHVETSLADIAADGLPLVKDDLLLPVGAAVSDSFHFLTPTNSLQIPLQNFQIDQNVPVITHTKLNNLPPETDDLPLPLALTLPKTTLSEVSSHDPLTQIDKLLNDEFLLPVNKNPPSVSLDNSPPTIIEMLLPMNKSSSVTPVEDISPRYLPFATDNLSLPISAGLSNDFLVDNNLLVTLLPEVFDLPTAIDDLSLLVEPETHTTSGPEVIYDDPPLDMGNLTLPIDELLLKTFISKIPINNLSLPNDSLSSDVQTISDSTVNIVSLPVGKCPPNMLSETLTDSDTNTLQVPIDDRPLLEQNRGSSETLLFNVPAKSPMSNVPEIASNFLLPMAPRLPHTPLSKVSTHELPLQMNKLSMDEPPAKKFISCYPTDSMQVPIDKLRMQVGNVVKGPSNIDVNDLSTVINELPINKVQVETSFADIAADGLPLVKDDLLLPLGAAVSDSFRFLTPTNSLQIPLQNFEVDQNVPVITHTELNNLPPETDDLPIPLALTLPKTTLSEVSSHDPLIQIDNLSLPIDDLAGPISDFTVNKNNPATPLFTDIINRPSETNNLLIQMAPTVLETPLYKVPLHNRALKINNFPLLIDEELPNTSLNTEVPVDKTDSKTFKSDVQFADGLPILNDEFLLPVNKIPPSVSLNNSPPTIIEMLLPMNKSSSVTPVEDISPGYLPFATDNLSLPISVGLSNNFLVDNNLSGTLLPEVFDLPTAIDDLSLLLEPATHTTLGPKVISDDPPLDMDNLTLPIDELLLKTFISKVPINNLSLPNDSLSSDVQTISDSTVNIVSLPVGKYPPNMLSETLTDSDTNTLQVPIGDRPLLEQDRGSSETLLFNVPAKSPMSNVPEIASNFLLPMAPRLPHTPLSNVSTHELPFQMNKLSMDEPPAKKFISCYPTDSMQVPIDKLSMQVGNVVERPSNIDVNDLSTAINELPINKVQVETSFADIAADGLPLVKDDLLLPVGAAVSDSFRFLTPTNSLQIPLQNFQVDQNVPVITHTELNNLPPETDDLPLPLALTFPKTTLSEVSSHDPLIQIDNLSLPIDDLAGPISDFTVNKNKPATPLFTDIINRPSETNNLLIQMAPTVLETPLYKVPLHNRALKINNFPLLMDEELPNTSLNTEVPVDKTDSKTFKSDVQFADGLPILNDEFLLQVNETVRNVSINDSPPSTTETLSPMNEAFSNTHLEDISPGDLPLATDDFPSPISAAFSNDFLVDKSILIFSVLDTTKNKLSESTTLPINNRDIQTPLLKNLFNDFTGDGMSSTENHTLSVNSSYTIIVEQPLPRDKMRPDMSDSPTYDENIHYRDKEHTLSQRGSPTNDVPLATDKTVDRPGSKNVIYNNQLRKLKLTKALLENVLSDINKGGFTFPVESVIPVSLPPELSTTDLPGGKSLLDHPPIDDLTVSVDDEFPKNALPDTIKDNLSMLKDKMLQMNPFFDIFSDSVPMSMETKLLDTEETLSKILLDDMGSVTEIMPTDDQFFSMG